MSIAKRCILALQMLTIGASAMAVDLAAPESLIVPKGTKLEHGLVPGQYRFWLPDGRVVSIKEYEQEKGTAAEVGIFNKMGKVMVRGENVTLSFVGTATKDEVQKLSPGDYFEFDDATVLLPATVRYRIRVEPPAPPTQPTTDGAASHELGELPPAPKGR